MCSSADRFYQKGKTSRIDVGSIQEALKHASGMEAAEKARSTIRTLLAHFTVATR
jgi:hypothetical protein